MQGSDRVPTLAQNIERRVAIADAARQAMDLAAEQGHRLGRNYIDTERLLLSVLSDHDNHEGVGASTLSPLGIARTRCARTRVKERSGRGQHARGKSLPWTPRAQRILTLSQRRAPQPW
jgi:hypothetical protein